MKTANHGPVASVTAAAALSAYLFAGPDGNYCAANKKALGVIVDDTLQGDQAPVQITGIALVRAGAPITTGGHMTPVVCNAAHKAVAATTFAASIAVDVDADLTAGGTIPSGETPVTSSSASPAVAVTGTIAATATATPTLTGSVLPQAINGYALDDAAAEDDIIRILLVA